MYVTVHLILDILSARAHDPPPSLTRRLWLIVPSYIIAVLAKDILSALRVSTKKTKKQ